MTTETLRLRVRYVGLVEGTPTQFAFTKLLTQPGGKHKRRSHYVPVEDAELLARLRTEFDAGEEVEIVLETDGSQPGIPQFLRNVFSLTSTARTAAEVTVAV